MTGMGAWDGVTGGRCATGKARNCDSWLNWAKHVLNPDNVIEVMGVSE
jgi:hypothetical protein